MQVAAGLTYGAEEDLFHTLFKTAWGNKPLPMLSTSDGANVRAAPRVPLCTQTHNIRTRACLSACAGRERRSRGPRPARR